MSCDTESSYVLYMYSYVRVCSTHIYSSLALQLSVSLPPSLPPSLYLPLSPCPSPPPPPSLT